jgi:hypothetical protein
MKEAKICLGDDNLGRSRVGIVHGPICLRVDGFSFPDLQWTDFVVVILTWWCRALFRILEGDRGPVEVRFMEGPFLVELGPQGKDTLRLTLVEAGLKRRIVRNADVKTAPLIRSIISASDRTLIQCKKHQWWSNDEDCLAAAREDLGKIIPGIIPN